MKMRNIDDKASAAGQLLLLIAFTGLVFGAMVRLIPIELAGYMVVGGLGGSICVMAFLLIRDLFSASR